MFQHPFVDGAKLFDAQVVVRNAPASERCARGRQGLDQGLDHVFRDAALLHQRRVPRRKQAAVERRDIQIAGLAAGMGEASDGLERRPQSPGRW